MGRGWGVQHGDNNLTVIVLLETADCGSRVFNRCLYMLSMVAEFRGRRDGRVGIN